MSRALTLTCRVILTLCLVGLSSATALAKPLVAVLGLEVVDRTNGGSGTDQAATKFASELSVALRDRAVAGGPYNLQVNADKELVDEKLIKSCDSEQPTCMAPIGLDLGAAYLIYGSIEKKPGGYIVKVLLLNVAHHAVEKTWLPSQLPFTDAKDNQSQGFKDFARKGYNFLTGTNATPLRISVTNTNVDRGSVLIDGDERGALIQGTASIAGVAEGKHRIAIEVGGFQRYEANVTVTADEPLTPITLIPLPEDRGVIETHHKPCGPDSMTCTGSVSSSSGSGNTLWKTTAVTGFVVAAVAGGIMGWEYHNINAFDGKSIPLKDAGGGVITALGGNTTMTRAYSSDECNDTTVIPSGQNMDLNPGGVARHNAGNSIYDKACTGVSASHFLIPITIGAAFVGVAGLIMALHHSDDEQRPASGSTVGHRQKKSSFAVTPVISPDGAGATVQIDW
jgi:hypothetical protein